jgi:spoIIIJ-associated protein
MLKIEAKTLDAAYEDAAQQLNCSIVDLNIEIVQNPSNGFLGFFAKTAIIVVVKKENKTLKNDVEVKKNTGTKEVSQSQKTSKVEVKKEKEKSVEIPKTTSKPMSDTIMPESFVTDQEEHEDDDNSYADSDDSNYVDTGYEDDSFYDDEEEDHIDIHAVASEVEVQINKLFKNLCFEMEEISVGVYDDVTLMITFNGKDAALLIGKEGYRYKALSYMIFNWINSKYDLQLRLEIAEFLKNQEEAISRYLVGVCESIDRDGRAQTKTLDGVLVQIALLQLREQYPDKYVAIRTTRDGNKYIIVNEYNNSSY